MFRGTIFRTTPFRGTGMGLSMGVGTLNVEDYKNYRSRFLLIADTFANFMLNGELIDGTKGALIKNSGYYEAAIIGPDGNLHISRFCYWRTAIAQVDVVSEAVMVSDLDYKAQRSNKESNMILYHDHPVVAHVYDTGSPVLSGVVGDRDFYRMATDIATVRILPSRHVYIYDDPVIWQGGYQKQVGYLVRPSTANDRYYRCTNAGITGMVEPTWPITAGDTVVDGTATWECVSGTRELHFFQRVTTG